eukprot:3066162-Pleurochrysis_carterae.AAC.1
MMSATDASVAAFPSTGSCACAPRTRRCSRRCVGVPHGGAAPPPRNGASAAADDDDDDEDDGAGSSDAARSLSSSARSVNEPPWIERYEARNASSREAERARGSARACAHAASTR